MMTEPAIPNSFLVDELEDSVTYSDTGTGILPTFFVNMMI